MTTANDFTAFKEFMSSTPRGEITLSDEVAKRLAACWHELAGGTEQNMEGAKIYSALFPYNRMEDVQWNPPLLSFVIERHGRQTAGSTRAEVHEWTVNCETRQAAITGSVLRSIGGTDKKLDVGPLAEEVARLVLERKNDPRLKWQDQGRVKVAIATFIPTTNWRTTKGRQDRFRKAVVAIVGQQGWAWCERPRQRDYLELNVSGDSARKDLKK